MPTIKYLRDYGQDAMNKFVEYRSFLKNGKLEKATRGFLELTQQYPDVPPGHFWLGETYRQRGLLTEAVVAFDEAIRLNPEWGEGLYHRGLCFEAGQMLEQARADYTAALGLANHASEKVAELHFRRGVCFQGKEHRRAAIKDLLAATQMNSDFGVAHLCLGLRWNEMRRREKAIESLSRAIELIEDCAPALLARAAAYMATHAWTAALIDLSKAIDIIESKVSHPRTDEEAYQECAKAYRGRALCNKRLDDLVCARGDIRQWRHMRRVVLKHREQCFLRVCRQHMPKKTG